MALLLIWVSALVIAIGATARLMLIQAAAKQWGVSTERIDTRAGMVIEIGGQKRRASYGSLAEAAMQVPAPARAGIKADPKDFEILGKPTRRLDSREKVDGRAEFGIDKKLPGLRVAVIARPPVFGGRAAKVDPEKAKAVKGVVAVLPVQVDRGGAGVAVVADGFWPAKQGRDLLAIEWALPIGIGTAEQLTQYRQLALQPGLPARSDGDAGAVAGAARRIDAEFAFPYLAHAAMEPLSCTVDLQADRMTVWCGSQFQTVDQAAAAKAMGLTPDKVKLHTLPAGGGLPVASGGPRATIYSFIDAFDVHRKSLADWQELAGRGLRRVYIGIETGDDALLRFLRKPGSAANVVEAVRTLKAGGVAVSVIIMTGVGGSRFSVSHVDQTLAALAQMDLAAGDINSAWHVE